MKKQYLTLSLIAFLAFLTGGCASKLTFYRSAPSLLPNTISDMKTPGFWISLHPNPDEVILTPEQIKDLNSITVRELKLTRDFNLITNYFSVKMLIQSLNDNFAAFSKKKFYFKNGRRAKKDFYSEIKENLNYNGIYPDSKYKYAFVVEDVNQRLLPVSRGLYYDPVNVDIDALQNDVFDIGTVLLIHHESFDGRWYYASSLFSSGWVEAEKIVLCSRQEMLDYYNKAPFVVVTEPKTELYFDADLKKYYGYIRMGTRMPLFGDADSGKSLKVIVPYKDKNGDSAFGSLFVSRDNVRKGYLPYTPGVIIKQAFKLFNSPYGWGGMYGENDSPSFIQKIFLTVGIRLPRTTEAQSKLGVSLCKFSSMNLDIEKAKDISKESIGGITLLHLDGHVMLYLGQVENNPYVIHEIWGYSERFKNDEVVWQIKRAEVTDLSLGMDSTEGSLMRRLFSALAIK